MKKSLRFLLLLFTFHLLMACGEEEETNANGFAISTQGQAILLPVGASGTTFDCNLKEFTGNRFSLSNVRMSWSKFDRDLTIIFIKLEAEHPSLGGVYSKVYSAEDFEDIFFYDDPLNIIPNTGFVPAPLQGNTREISLRAGCSLIFDGIVLNNENVNFTTSAIITIQAVATGNAAGVAAGTVTQGDEISVRSTATFNLIYNKN